MTVFRRFTIALALLVAWPAVAETPAADGTILFSPVPQQSAAATAERWGPLVEALAEMTGLDITLRIASDIPTFEACLFQGAFDVAFMNPYHFTVFSDRVGYTAIAHRDGPGLRGILVARTDSDFVDLTSVSGQRLAFPSPAAFGASVLIRGELHRRGIPFEPVFVKSHASVYLAVNARAMYAGGGVGRTFKVAPDVVRPNLRIVYETDAYTPHAFAVHPSMTDAAQTAIQTALVHLAQTSPEALVPLGVSGWRIPDAEAYEDVRALNTPETSVGMADLESRECHFG